VCFGAGPSGQASAFGELGGLSRPPGRAGRNRAGGPGRIEAGQARKRLGEPGIGREHVRSHWVGYHARRARAEQLDKHRCYLLTDRDGPAGPGGIDYHPAQTAIGTVEGQVQTWHRNQRGFTRHTGGKSFEDYLASLALKTRREVVHDYNSTPLLPPWPAFSAGT
jgi:hypothetical protein